MKTRKPRASHYGPDLPEDTSVNVQVNYGAGYTAAEAEFLKAVERYQKAERRKFLSHVDYLRIALSLGYVRPAEPAP